MEIVTSSRNGEGMGDAGCPKNSKDAFITSNYSSSTSSRPEIPPALPYSRPISVSSSVFSLNESCASSSAMQSSSDKSLVSRIPWREAVDQTVSDLRKLEKVARKRHIEKFGQLESRLCRLQQAPVSVPDHITSSCNTITGQTGEHPGNGAGSFRWMGRGTQRQIRGSRGRRRRSRPPQKQHLNVVAFNSNRIFVMNNDSRHSSATNENFPNVKSLHVGDETVPVNPSLYQSVDCKESIFANINLCDTESSGLEGRVGTKSSGLDCDVKLSNIAGSTDPDICFFLNILPDIKGLDSARKLAFKSDVMKILTQLVQEQNWGIQYLYSQSDHSASSRR